MAKIRRILVVAGLAIALGAAAGFGVVACLESARRARTEAALAFVSGTAESGRLVLAETRGTWEGVRRVPASVLGLRSDWQARYRAGYLVRWYDDFLEDGPPALSLVDGKARARVPALRSYPPQILPETFAILAEDRSVLVDEERAKVELFRALGEELAVAAPNLVDPSQARGTAREALRKLVRDACVRAGLRVDGVEVAFADD